MTGRCAHGHGSLPASAGRLVALTLATYTDGDGTIPARFSPSLTALARASGLGRSTVMRALADLEEAGWIERRQPPVHLARTQGATTRYRLSTPSPTTDLGPERAYPPRPTAGPDLGPQRDPPRPTAGPNQHFQHKPAAAPASETTTKDEDMKTDPHATQIMRTGEIHHVDEATAIKMIDAWASDRPHVTHPFALLASMPNDKIHDELSRYKPRAAPAPPCPDCLDDGWIFTDPADPNSAHKCTHPRRSLEPVDASRVGRPHGQRPLVTVARGGAAAAGNAGLDPALSRGSHEIGLQ